MQLFLPVNPEGAQPVNALVAIEVRGDQVAYFAGGVPVFMHALGDRVGARLAACQLLTLKLAKKKQLAQALSINRVTLYRQQRKMMEEGVGGLVDEIRGPKGAHKLTGELLAQGQQCLNEGKSIRQVAAVVGVSKGTIYHAMKRGHLCRSLPAGSGVPVPSEPKLGEGSQAEPALGPGERVERAMQSAAGVGVCRHEERAMTSLGSLEQAMPAFEAMEAVEHGGAFAAIPALMAQGLVEMGKAVYGSLRNGFYGLQSVLLTFGLTALLRVRNPEQLQYYPPAELGVLLGLDRIPEVKTLRRKLDEMAQQKKAAEFSRRLAEGWVKQDPDTVGFLYVDGHVRPYHGHKHDLPETHVARRRLCMDATTDFWVNDANAEPVFEVTAPANNSLASMLREEILPQVRQLVGERTATVVFDREGWSPKLFAEIISQGFHVLTYRKGKQEPWPVECFSEAETEIDGQKVQYLLAERSVLVQKGFWMREIRRLCADGHQTSLLTSQQGLTEVELAYRMFSRWRQENFFRYMRHHFALDTLVNYEAEAADSQRLVPNPQKRAAKAKVMTVQQRLQKVESEYAHEQLEASEATGKKRLRCEVEAQQLAAENRSLCQQRDDLKKEAAALPSHVPVKEGMEIEKIVRLSPEAKHLTDTIKMVAYRAETALTRLLMPHYARNQEEGRAF
ncbi:MAG: putative transposase [Dehalococcoidia bacterium]